jgi:hypothetical protein
MERLSISTVAMDAARCCWQLRWQLLRALAVPATGYIALGYWMEPITAQNWAQQLLLSWAMTAILAIAAISFHRIILLGPASVPPLGVDGSNRREWRFIGNWIGLYLVVLLLMTVSMAVLMHLLALLPGNEPMQRGPTDFRLIAFALAKIPALFVLSRLSLALPAIALDQPLGLRSSWQLTKGHGWRITVLVAGLPWLLHASQRTMANLFATDSGYFAVHTALFLLLLPLEIALLSRCYQQLKPLS